MIQSINERPRSLHDDDDRDGGEGGSEWQIWGGVGSGRKCKDRIIGRWREEKTEKREIRKQDGVGTGGVVITRLIY